MLIWDLGLTSRNDPKWPEADIGIDSNSLLASDRYMEKKTAVQLSSRAHRTIACGHEGDDWIPILSRTPA